jgi:hypothetical protein
LNTAQLGLQVQLELDIWHARHVGFALVILSAFACMHYHALVFSDCGVHSSPVRCAAQCENQGWIVWPHFCTLVPG